MFSKWSILLTNLQNEANKNGFSLVSCTQINKGGNFRITLPAGRKGLNIFYFIEHLAQRGTRNRAAFIFFTDTNAGGGS